MKKARRKNSNHIRKKASLTNTLPFFVEEMVWQAESSFASNTENGDLSVDQGYRLLEHCFIPWSRFLVYAYLRRVGYTVKPHRWRFPLSLFGRNDVVDPSTQKFDKPRFPSVLLDQFPSISSTDISFTPVNVMNETSKMLNITPITEPSLTSILQKYSKKQRMATGNDLTRKVSQMCCPNLLFFH
ncbi:hypothetical protein AB6A40_009333 [Gnathostoma spinigerum]|uniref:Uncharacterized protein n=1 Tax=Gnathostoma spinigerum TaxID=75299 RepID=A0ABD6EZB9_9BILA